jgi:hypothetical protein
MAKPNPLTQALNRKHTESAPVPTPAMTPARSRVGRVLVGGHFSKDVQRMLKIIAAEEGTTIQALLAEGINHVLAKRGKPEIADVYTI